MRNIIKEAPEVAKAFFLLTEEITKYSNIDLKVKELVLIGIFTASGGIRGVGTHIERAIKNGATKEEVYGAILLALPVVGISNVNIAVEKAEEILEGTFKQNEACRP